MPRNHHETIRALRAKADDKAVTPEEAKILRDKADELEAKYGKPSSPSTDQTTTGYNPFERPFGWEPPKDGSWAYWESVRENPPPPPGPDAEEAWRQLWELYHNQWQWNKPPEDEADIVEEDYAEQPEDEDYGYDMNEGEDW